MKRNSFGVKKPDYNVLIVDEDQESIRLLLEVLARKGIRGMVAASPKDAIDILDKHHVDLVFSSVDLDRSEKGFQLVQQMQLNSPERPVVMAARSSEQDSQQLIDLAIESVNAGCRSFLMKPLERSRIETLLDTILPNQQVEAVDLDGYGQQTLLPIVGKSSRLIQTVNLAKKIAATSLPVLISGESGTGKELVASLIHNKSKRANAPYMQVNCAALNDTLLESELFGHEKGAFTGAHARRKGRFERAHGGTLLLDEITETPIKFQATLLRVLEQQDFERVGGNDSVQVDVRIISTTNRDLADEVAQGRFRQDLYYRLCGVRLIVPPLRERVDDLTDLVWHFVNLYSCQTNRRITSLSEEMMGIFANYQWPGNIRQLRNVVRTSLALGTGPTLSLADASWLFDDVQPRIQKEISPSWDAPDSMPDLSGLPLAQVERRAILDTLEQTSGNQTKAAKILGISDRTLRGKMRQYREQELLQPV